MQMGGVIHTFGTVNPEYFVHQNFCSLAGQNISYARSIHMEDNNTNVQR